MKALTTGKLVVKLGVILLGAVLLLCFIAPYIHIILSKEDTHKVFGFRNLRSFLYAIGLPISLFTCATLLLFAGKYVPSSIQKVYIKIGGFLFLYSAVFQFIWIFWATTDLSKGMYYLSIALISIVVTVLYIKTVQAYQDIVYRLKRIIRRLFAFIISDVDDKALIDEHKKDAFVKEREAVMEEVSEML